MSLRSHIATAALLTLLGSANCWAEPLGVIAALDGVYRVDLATRQATELGFTGQYAGQLVAVEGMAYSPDGTLYSVADNLKSLFRIDPRNGAASFVGPLGLSGEGQFSNLDTAFAITADGRAWLASAVVGKLWQVDLGTGTASPVGDLGFKVSGLAARGNELFAAGCRGDEGLYRVDQDTGAARLIGGFKKEVPYAPTISIGFDAQNKLWAVINYNPPQTNGSLSTWSDLAEVDVEAGTIKLDGSLTGPDSLRTIAIRGLSIAAPTAVTATVDPVPAGGPLAIGLLVLGLGIFGGLHSRRRVY